MLFPRRGEGRRDLRRAEVTLVAGVDPGGPRGRRNVVNDAPGEGASVAGGEGPLAGVLSPGAPRVSAPRGRAKGDTEEGAFLAQSS